MKNVYFIVGSLLFISVWSHAQPAFPTYEQRPVWCIKSSPFGRPQPEYTIEMRSDTVICGKKYNPLFVKNRSLGDGVIYNYISGYIRQDNKKVYQLSTDCQSEGLLYDFSLQVGDTVKHSYYEEGMVSKIDTEEINGIKRKVMTIDYPVAYSPFPVPPIQRFWIEGIGSPIEPYGDVGCLYSVCESASYVACLSTNAGVIFGNCTEGCGIRTATKELSSSSLLINLAVNPIGINTSVQLRYAIENDFHGKFYVSNLLGQVLFTKSFILYQIDKSVDLPWSPTAPGIYWLVFESERGERQRLRLVAQ